jgi:hypothetical protein
VVRSGLVNIVLHSLALVCGGHSAGLYLELIHGID